MVKFFVVGDPSEEEGTEMKASKLGKVWTHHICVMANTWANIVGKHEEALSFLKAGLEANSRYDVFY